MCGSGDMTKFQQDIMLPSFWGKGMQSIWSNCSCILLKHIVLVSFYRSGWMDNLKFHRLMVSHVEENYDKQLLDTSSCGLHQIHGAFKNALEKNFQFECLQRVFKSLFYLFDDAPVWKDEFTVVTGSSKFGLQFCKHRWVENLPVAKHALEIWSDIKKYVEAVEKKDKRLTKPCCRSYTDIVDATKDPVVVV